MGVRYLANGIEVSNDTHKTHINNNDMIIGTPGSGKTTGYVSHLLLNPFGSYVVSDTKGLLHRKFTKYLISKGYHVEVIDFVNPEKSAPYNPLSYIHTNANGGPSEKDIKKLAVSLFDVHNTEDLFWVRMAERYVSMLIAFVLEALPESEQTMKNVVTLHHDFLSGRGRDTISDWSESNPESFTARKFKDLENSRDAEKMWFSTMEFVNEALDPFDYSEFDAIFSNPDSFDISRLGREKTVLFLNTSDNDRSFGKLCTLFHTQALQTLIQTADSEPDGRLPVPTRLILDDFAASAKIDDFDNLTSIIRSREISVSILLQNISQLEEMYSPSAARTISNNCDHILYINGHDPATAHFIASHINKTVHTVLNKDRNKAILITEGIGGQFVDRLEMITTVEAV